MESQFISVPGEGGAVEGLQEVRELIDRSNSLEQLLLNAARARFSLQIAKINEDDQELIVIQFEKDIISRALDKSNSEPLVVVIPLKQL